MKKLTPHPIILYFLKHIHFVLVPAVVLAGAVAVIILGFVDRDYSSQMKVLVVQKYTLTDSYTAAKSAEKVAQNLGTVVQTSMFLTQVVESGQVNLSSLVLMNEQDKRKAWAKKVEVNVTRGQSIMELTAYDPDAVRVQQLIEAVVSTLLDNGASYHGAPDTIELRVVDTALTSKRPARPSVSGYSVGAGLLGVVLGALYLFFRMDESLLGSGLFGRGGSGEDAGTARRHEERGQEHIHETAHIQRDVAHEHGSHDAASAVPPYAVLDVTNFHKHITKK